MGIKRGTSSDIAEELGGGSLIEPGCHNMLVYDDLRGFREIYSQYARLSLPENEILLLATQYETIDRVKTALADSGVDVKKYTDEGMLYVVDAQQGYFIGDIEGTFKLALTLVARAKKENRRGFTWIGDMGSFFGLHRVEEMMGYELSRPQKFEDAMKTVCCYHQHDFDSLGAGQKKALLDHHYKSIMVE